jgi:hypothetical protein
VTVKENLRLEQRREYMAAPVRADPIAEGGMRFTFPLRLLPFIAALI